MNKEFPNLIYDCISKIIEYYSKNMHYEEAFYNAHCDIYGKVSFKDCALILDIISEEANKRNILVVDYNNNPKFLNILYYAQKLSKLMIFK